MCFIINVVNGLVRELQMEKWKTLVPDLHLVIRDQSANARLAYSAASYLLTWPVMLILHKICFIANYIYLLHFGFYYKKSEMS